MDSLEDGIFPTPLEAAGGDDVLVGRVRRPEGERSALLFFACAESGYISGQTIGIVYVGFGTGQPRGQDDAREARLFPAANPPAPLAFDHALIVADYLHWRTTGEFPRPWRSR